MAQPTPPKYHAPRKKTAKSSGQPAPPSASAQASDYQNNPFVVALDGISGLFRYAKTLAIIMLVVSLLGVLVNALASVGGMINGGYKPDYYSTPADTRWQDGEALPPSGDDVSYEAMIAVATFVGLFLLIALPVVALIGIFLNGLRDTGAAAVANRRETSFGTLFGQLWGRLIGYIGLQLLIAVKVFLWSLLFIVPGIIMAIRYSLAGTAFFARDLKARDALRYSTTITKGGWLTTFASYGLFNVVTFGLLSALSTTGTQGVLFRQFDAYEQAGKPKPGAHVLSIVFVALYILLIALGLALVGALGFWFVTELPDQL